MSDQSSADVLRHTANVVSAHLGHNKTAVEALPQLIQSVYRTLAGLGEEPEVAAKPEPAVPWKKSVFPDYIICLEDGAKMKTLKRYIGKRFGLTPAAYRERWGLPSDYPMVAPSYARRRSEMALESGLGRKPAAQAPAEVIETQQDEVEVQATKGRGRHKAAATEVQE